MNKLRKIFGFSFIFLIFLSCQKPEQSNKVQLYWQINEHIKAQIELLKAMNPMVEKEVTILDQKESKRIQVKDWNQELTMFLGLDLNKPSRFGRYQIKDSMGINNKKYLIYSTLHANLPIKKVVLELQNDKLNHLYALMIDENYLYLSKKELEMDFNINKNQESFLKGYKMKSHQKILWHSPKDYNLKVIVL